MGELDGEIWVCAECRSINNARAKQCYNCRTPRDRAAVDPTTIEGTGHGKLRDVALPRFHSPRPYAILASILVLLVTGMQVVHMINVTTLGNQVLGGTQATEEQWAFLGMFELATLGVGALALIAWSIWLSRAVVAMPALGLGYPAANGLMAFVENFLPGLNLLRVPAIVRDVVRRIEPGQNRGEALIFAAWISLLLGFVVPRVGAFLTGFGAESDQDVLRGTVTTGAAATAFVFIGALFLVALIWWIEQRIARRREAQLAAIDAATAGAAEVAETTEEGVSVPIVPRGDVPAASSPWSWRDTSDSPLARSAEGETTQASIAPGAGWDNEFALASIPAAPARQAAPAAPESGDVQTSIAAEPTRAPEPPSTADPPAAPEHQPAAEPPPAPEPIAPAAAPAARVMPIEATERSTSDVASAAAIEQTVAPAMPPHVTPVPVTVAPANAVDEPLPVENTTNGAPHLTIRIANRGLLEAEMGGETEPVILEDLTAYGNALANAGGSAEIVLAGSDDMVHLIARRAQRILADTGIDASLPD